MPLLHDHLNALDFIKEPLNSKSTFIMTLLIFLASVYVISICTLYLLRHFAISLNYIIGPMFTWKQMYPITLRGYLSPTKNLYKVSDKENATHSEGTTAEWTITYFCIYNNADASKAFFYPFQMSSKYHHNIMYNM